MFKKLLVVLVMPLMVISCGNDDSDNVGVPVEDPIEVPADRSSNPGNHSDQDAGDRPPSGDSDESTASVAPESAVNSERVQTLGDTDLIDYLNPNESIETKNLKGQVLEMASGWKGKAVVDGSEVDEEGYSDGAAVELLLNEDFTYELRVQDIKLKTRSTISWMKAPKSPKVYTGQWNILSRKEISLEGVGQGKLFYSSELGEPDRFVLTFSEPAKIDQAKELEGFVVATEFRAVNIDLDQKPRVLTSEEVALKQAEQDELIVRTNASIGEARAIVEELKHQSSGSGAQVSVSSLEATILDAEAVLLELENPRHAAATNRDVKLRMAVSLVEKLRAFLSSNS